MSRFTKLNELTPIEIMAKVLAGYEIKIDTNIKQQFRKIIKEELLKQPTTQRIKKMNTNTKELTNEITGIASTAECTVALMEGLSFMADSIEGLEDGYNKTIMINISNGLRGAITLLSNEVVSKLFAFDDNYDSIKGEPRETKAKKETGL